MSKAKRINISIQDIEERIDNAKDDVLWRELPQATKVRVLIIERLEQLEKEKESSNQEKT
jgi:hypothetical protein